jgi:hypothetical protein
MKKTLSEDTLSVGCDQNPEPPQCKSYSLPGSQLSAYRHADMSVSARQAEIAVR